MKKVYFLIAAALSSMTIAQGQSVIDQDTEIMCPWDLNDEWGTEGLEIIGATVTITHFSMNVAGLPPAYAIGASWQPVTLSNGGKVKFYDCPAYAYPTEETFDEIDAANVNPDYNYSWADCDKYSSTSINNDWVIEGTGNEIYLDSYCTFTGTMTGGSAEDPAEVTIYCTNKSQIGTVFASANNPATNVFYGTVYLKTLEGYSTDTIFFTDAFRPGNGSITSTYPNVYQTKAYYTTDPMRLDITGANHPVLMMDFSQAMVPPVVGEGTIFVQRYPQFNGWSDGAAVYDCTINGGTEYSGYNFEIYGGDLVFNKPVNYVAANGTGVGYAYCRSGAAIYNNSPQPSFSNVENGFSQRGTGITGGTGYWDVNYSPNGGRINYLSAGYPYTEVGQMIWKNVYMYNSNVVRYDFDNEGHSDIINIAADGQFHLYSGQNEIYIGTPDSYTPVAGNYKVINGDIDASLSSYVDTIGYEVWDNNGCAYVIRSVKGGETVTSAATGETFTAQPGDSIGSATFGVLASTYGATCMDGNRPHYVIAQWGKGTYSADEYNQDSTLKNMESPSLYTINPEQKGTANDPDSAWAAIWEAFDAAHPVSNAWEAVETTDGSVIPGTVTDSIFLTYSYYHDASAETGIAGGHAWSWKNGSGYLCSDHGYPYASAITYSYYYYSNNTVRLYGNSGTKYINGEDTLSVSLSQITLPIALTQNHDSIATDTTITWSYTYAEDGVTKLDSVASESYTWAFQTDTIGKRWYTAWSAKTPQANGDSVSYRFNFKFYLTDGIISVETMTYPAGATEPVYETPAENIDAVKEENVSNAGDIVGMRTLAKEVHAVGNRAVYTLDGRRMNGFVRGINIVKTTYTDGTYETKRVIIK